MKKLLRLSVLSAVLVSIGAFLSAGAAENCPAGAECKAECKATAAGGGACCASSAKGTRSVSLKLRRVDDAALKQALAKVGGVTGVETCSESKFTTVSFAGDQACPDKVMTAVRKAGYRIQARKVTFAVEGLSCGACSAKVDQVLTKVRGVSEAHACHEGKTATVVFNPSRVSSEKLIAAIKAAGFEATESLN